MDTNVLIYQFDSRDSAKRDRANKWLELLWVEQAGRLSWQVLHEFCNASPKAGVPPNVARETVALYLTWKPVNSSLGLLERTWHWKDNASLSFWDSMVVAAAERCEAAVLLSEDMQDGRTFGTVQVVNPFKHEPSDMLGTRL